MGICTGTGRHIPSQGRLPLFTWPIWKLGLSWSYFYDGRMAAMIRAGHGWVAGGANFLKTAAQNHIERQMALQAFGVNVTSRYGNGLLRLLARYGLRGKIQPISSYADPEELPCRFRSKVFAKNPPACRTLDLVVAG